MTVAHRAMQHPSPWVCRHLADLAPGSRVLDLACGGGRHARWLAERGVHVEAVDRDREALAALSGIALITVREADLEGGPWPWDEEPGLFDAVVVTNYLHRPRFAALLDCVAPAGRLVYETFMLGNERFGKPSNPAFLLQPGELLQRIDQRFAITAFEQGEVVHPAPALIQRVCAVRGAGAQSDWPRLD